MEIFPNPFQTFTNISFDLHEKAIVQAIIYNLSGIEVKKLIDTSFLPGKHNLLWNGDDNFGKKTPDGIYFIKISTEGRVITEKINLLPLSSNDQLYCFN